MSVPTRTQIVLLCLIIIAAAGSARADEAPKLLSRNATYSLRGFAYIYIGQIQPGVNERTASNGYVYTPLVETTDSGDDLINGDASDDSNVHTPWIWRQPGKKIEVELTLPGDSKVSRVHLQFPQNTAYRPEAVTLETRAASGKW